MNAGDARRRAVHTCHAKGCRTLVRPALFMCRKHGAMVPPALRTALLAHLRPRRACRRAPPLTPSREMTPS
jgi:hypothetical protein